MAQPHPPAEPVQSYIEDLLGGDLFVGADSEHESHSGADDAGTEKPLVSPNPVGLEGSNSVSPPPEQKTTEPTAESTRKFGANVDKPEAKTPAVVQAKSKVPKSKVPVSKPAVSEPASSKGSPAALAQANLAEPDRRKQQLQTLFHKSAIEHAKTAPKSQSPQPRAPEPAVTTKQSAVVATPLPTQSDAPTLAPASGAQVSAADVVSPEQGSIVATSSGAGGSDDWIDGRPSWAQNRFDVLLFSVSQLNLAVPLVALGQIQKITEELTPLFGQADWFMGLLPTAQGKVRCVDTALFVMRERYRPEFRDGYQFVITINELPWGLAVDGVNQPISLEPDEVNWRGSRSQRPWLAGTVKEHMCALLDIPKLGEVLAQQDKSSKDKK